MDWGAVASIAERITGWTFAALVLAWVVWQFMGGKLVQGALLDRSLGISEKALPAIEANTAASRELAEAVRKNSEALERIERRLDPPARSR